MKKPHPLAQLVYPITWNGEICGEPYWQWYGNTSSQSITELLAEEVIGGLWCDPYAGENGAKYAQFTNDLARGGVYYDGPGGNLCITSTPPAI